MDTLKKAKRSLNKQLKWLDDSNRCWNCGRELKERDKNKDGLCTKCYENREEFIA